MRDVRGAFLRVGEFRRGDRHPQPVRSVDLYAGAFNAVMKSRVDYTRTSRRRRYGGVQGILHDWTNEASIRSAPEETGTASAQACNNDAAIERTRIATQRMPVCRGFASA